MSAHRYCGATPTTEGRLHFDLPNGMTAHLRRASHDRWQITRGPDCQRVTAWWALPDDWTGNAGMMRAVTYLPRWDGIGDPQIDWVRAWANGCIRRRTDPSDPSTSTIITPQRITP